MVRDKDIQNMVKWLILKLRHASRRFRYVTTSVAVEAVFSGESGHVYAMIIYDSVATRKSSKEKCMQSGTSQQLFN